MLVAAMGALAIRLGLEGILGTFMAGAILRLSKGGAAMTTREMRAKLKARLLKPLVVGATVLSVLNLASLSPAPRVHAALPPLPAADPCAAPLPASRVLPVASGIQTYTELIGGGLTFHLNQFGPRGLNAAVRRLGITPPAGDAVATWSLALPGGTRTYSGL